MRAGLLLALALALIAPLPFGATGSLSRGLIALTVAAGLAAAAWTGAARRPPAARFAALALATLVWGGVYLIPLPAGLIAELTPERAEQFARSLAAPGAPEPVLAAESKIGEIAGTRTPLPGWRPLAVDPDRAVDGWTHLAVTIGAFLLALIAVRDERERTWMTLALIGSAAFQAVYGLVESLSGHHQIFGFDKVHYLPLATGTFICPNHYAAVLSLGLFAAIGLLATSVPAVDLERREQAGARTAQLGVGVSVTAIVVIAMIWSSSRAALAAAAVGVALWVGVQIVQSVRGGASTRVVAALAALALLGGLLVAGAVWIRPPEPLADDISAVSVSIDDRATIWRSAREMIAADPWVGGGLGSFAPRHSLIRPATSGTRVVHAHSDYLEWWVETGVVGVVLMVAWILALAAAAFSVWTRRSRAALTLALSCGLIALALHETVDFSLKLTGVSVPAALAAGLLLAPLGFGPDERNKRASRRLWAVTLAACVIVLSVLGGWSVLRSRSLPPNAAGWQIALAPVDKVRSWARARIEHELERAAAGESDLSAATARIGRAAAALQKAGRRAPYRGELRLTSWIATQALLSAAQPNQPPPPAWLTLGPYYLTRAEELAPASRQRKLLLARYWLVAGDAAQARRVTRDLLSLDPKRAREAYRTLGELDLGQLMEATPNEPGAAIELARYLREERDDAMGARIVLRRALDRHAGHLALTVELAALQAHDGRYERAMTTLEEAAVPDADDASIPARRWWWLRADLTGRAGDFDEMNRALEQVVALGESERAATLARARAALRHGNDEEAIEQLERVLADSGRLGRQQELETILLLGATYKKLGRTRLALDKYRLAERVAPDDPRVLRFFEELDRATP